MREGLGETMYSLLIFFGEGPLSLVLWEAISRLYRSVHKHFKRGLSCTFVFI
jgi:hypothetical protein